MWLKKKDSSPPLESYEYEYDGEAPRFWFSSRFALAVLGFIGFLTMSAQRTCMQVAMVCMLNQTALGLAAAPGQALRPSPLPSSELSVNDWSTKPPNQTLGKQSPVQTAEDSRCSGMPRFSLLNDSEFSYLWDGEFTWSETRQRIVFDTYTWGYIVAQVPAGWLALKFGGKKIFGFFLLGASFSTALIPIVSRTHFFLLISLQFIGGVGAGATFPAMHTMWGKWAPPLERSILASITYAGSLTGSVFIYPVAGLLCKYGIDGQGFDSGWPAIFYIFGALGVVWFILWIIFASESPNDHKRIALDEKQYIHDTLMHESTDSEKMPNVPWSKALTSFSFIAIVMCNFTYEWGVYTFEKLFPRYTKEMLQMEVQWNDWFYIMPYFSLWLLVMASGGAADRLQSHGVLTTNATRKIMQLIGAVIPASMVAAMGFIDCSHWPATISFNTIGLGFCGFQYNGFLVNHLDIAPRLAGILMGISNAISSSAGFLVPSLLHIVTISAEGDSERWQTVFLITSSFYVISCAFFILCSSGRIQEWAINPSSDSRNLADFDNYPYPQMIDPSDTTVSPGQTTLNRHSSGNPEITYGGGENSGDDDEALYRQKNSGKTQPGSLVSNHLKAPSGAGSQAAPEDDADVLNRKTSSKSTNSSRSNDSRKEGGRRRRTDHERRERDRRARNSREVKRDRPESPEERLRPVRPPPNLTEDESFDVYESLSESPV